MYEQSSSDSGLGSRSFKLTDGGEQSGRLIFHNVRLARSPHEEQLTKLVGGINDGDVFWAIYLEGRTTPDGANESVTGYSVHILRRDNDPERKNFTFRNGTLSIRPETEVFFFEERSFADASGVNPSRKVFATPQAIQNFTTADGIRELLKTRVYRNIPDGTCTDRRCSHPSQTKHIRSAPLF